MSARRAREGKLRPIRRTQAARRTLRALRVDLEAFAEEVLDLAEVAVASRLVQLGVRRHKAARAAPTSMGGPPARGPGPGIGAMRFRAKRSKK